MITVGIWSGRGKPRFFIYDRNKNRSLLGFIIKKMSNVKCQMSGVVIVPGPGGFSTVRGAAVLVNTFVFAASTPLITVKPRFEESSKDIFRRGIKLLRSGKRVTYIAPHYGKEPNINKG